MRTTRLAAALLAPALLAGCAPALPASPGLGGSDGLAVDEGGDGPGLSAGEFTTTDLLPPAGCHLTVYDLDLRDEIRPIDLAYRKLLAASGWEWVKGLDIWQDPDEVPGIYISIHPGTKTIGFAVTDFR